MNLLKILIIVLVFNILVVSNAKAEYKTSITIQTKGYIHLVTFRGEFMDIINPYKPLVNLLLKATEKETIIIDIESRGGYNISADYIFAALNKTKAHTVAKIDSYAHSNAALLACHTKSVSIDKDAELMYHIGFTKLPYYDTYISHIQVLKRLLKESIQDQKICHTKGLMSDSEFELFKRGKDVYILGSDIQKRKLK